MVGVNSTGVYNVVPLVSGHQFDHTGKRTTLGNLLKSHNEGQRTYELKNHLGNVLATVGDYKIWKPITTRDLLINEGFSQTSHISNYQTVGTAALQQQSAAVTVSASQAESVISRVVPVPVANCSYEICITISQIVGNSLTFSLVDNGQEIDQTLIEEPGEYCFTAALSGPTSFSLTADAKTQFTLSQVTITSASTQDKLVADVLSAQDYYPGGVQMPGRVFTGSEGYNRGIKVNLQKPGQSAQDEQSKKELNPEKELAILGAIELFIGFNSRFFAGSITSCAKEAIFLGIA
jgi:hypothetical protein